MLYDDSASRLLNSLLDVAVQEGESGLLFVPRESGLILDPCIEQDDGPFGLSMREGVGFSVFSGLGSCFIVDIPLAGFFGLISNVYNLCTGPDPLVHLGVPLSITWKKLGRDRIGFVIARRVNEEG